MNMSITSKGELYCFPCAQYFHSQYEFNQHVRYHLKDNYLSSYMRYIEPYVCKQCHQSFKEKSDFVIHYKTHLHESMFVCGFCGKNCETYIHQKVHSLSCNKNDNISLISNETLNENVSSAHKDSMQVLSRNHLDVFASGNDSVHLTPYITTAEVTGQSSDQAKVLKPFSNVPFSYIKSFRSSIEYEKNGACNLRSKDYACEVCYEAFTRKCVLDVHRRKHMMNSNDKELVVHRCQTKASGFNPRENLFPSEKDLVPITPYNNSVEFKRKGINHTGNIKSSDEVLCSSVRKRCTIGNRKIPACNTRKKNAAEVCKEMFTVKCEQDVHKRKHGVKLIYNCDICQKIFKDNFKLRRHYVMHTGEKPFVCLKCDKRFTRKDHVQRHSVNSCKNTDAAHSNNTGKGSFTCTVCKKSFALKSDLKKHSSSHTDEKCHVCKKCGKRFIQQYRLVTHASSCNGTNNKSK